MNKILDYFEFSKIYKRVMDIELCLKQSFECASDSITKNSKFKRLIPFISNKYNISKYNYTKIKTDNKTETRNKLNDIINSQKEDSVKFKDFLKIVYLSDLLKLLTEYELLYKDKRFCGNLYIKKNELNVIKSKAAKLIDLRNIIMHFNIQSFKANKEIYIETLAFWESTLNCYNMFIHNLPKIKPTINNILNQIKEYDVTIFNENDRQIVDLFDEIALRNNLTINDLPKYWSIGRQIYSIKKDL